MRVYLSGARMRAGGVTSDMSYGRDNIVTYTILSTF